MALRPSKNPRPSSSTARRSDPPRRPIKRLLLAFGAGFAAAAIIVLISRTANVQSKGKEITELETRIETAKGLFDSERYSEALEEFTKASRLSPWDPRPYDGLGNVYRKMILEERAEEAYRKALECDPGYLPSTKSLCMLLYDFGRNKEAIDLLEEAAKKAPGDAFLSAEIALNEIRLGRPEKAIPLLEKYRAANPRDAWVHANLARAQAEAGNTREAEKAYRVALEIDPKMAIACLWLGQLLIATGRKSEAEPLLETFHKLRSLQTQEHNIKLALLREPNHVPTLVQLARIRYLLGKHQEAVTTFQRALQLAPGDASLRRLYDEMMRSLEHAGR
jgi:Flp pilus assembly protein TadD